MQMAHKRFEENLGRARDMRAMYLNLKLTLSQNFELSDILRASIVASVSSLDSFIHELSRLGIVEIYKGNRPKPIGYSKFMISIDHLQIITSNPNSTDWLEAEIRKQHSWQTFQHPDKIADAIRLVSSKELWKDVGERLGIDATTLKQQLSLIVDRRNKIAHEADADPSSPGSRWPIDESIVLDTIDSIERIGRAIFAMLISNS